MQNDCPICHKPFRPYPVGEKNGYLFSSCRACGSVTTSPEVTRDVLDRIFAEIKPEVSHVANPDGAIEGMRRALSKIIPPALTGKRFLDVAAEQGYAVMAARRLGMKAHGIDSHDFFTRFAQANYGAENFTHATVQDFAASGQQADFILCRQAFCIQTDPDGFTAALARLLAPGGKLYIEEPDGNSFWLPKSLSRWQFASPPLNFLYASFDGMKTMLKRHGLRIDRKYVTFAPAMRLMISK